MFIIKMITDFIFVLFSPKKCISQIVALLSVVVMLFHTIKRYGTILKTKNDILFEIIADNL